MKSFSASDFQADPGYQFRMSEGLKGVEGGAAARGGLLSGGALKAIQKYGQDLGSQEYGAAYGRYNSDQTNKYNKLAGMVNSGQGAANQVSNAAGQYGTNTATNIDVDLVNKSTAMYINGQWSVGVWLGPAKQSDGLDYGVGVLPYMKDKVTLNTGGVNVAFATSKHPEEAMEWLKWYAKEENAWGLIEAGIWMPVLSSFYTDEALTRKWVENPNFPPYDEYKSAVVDYAVSNARPTSWYWVNNTNKFNDALSSILAPAWSGNISIADAITQGLDQLKAANQGY